jgi:hypothetical protein
MADPLHDVRVALARGDTRFIGIKTFSTYAPGVEHRVELIDRFGIVFVEDISDTSGPDEATIEKTIEYAEIYNLVLFRALRDAGKVEFTPLDVLAK